MKWKKKNNKGIYMKVSIGSKVKTKWEKNKITAINA